MHISDTDDFSNQQRLYDLLRRAYFAEYSVQQQEHRLMPHIASEIQDFRDRMQGGAPSLALAVAMAKYHFAWYKDGTTEMDVESVQDAADMMYTALQFSQCDLPDLPAEVFHQRMCNARWPYAVMIYSELGREFASRYLTDQAADILERAVGMFDHMKRLPHYMQLTSWQSPYDINFNEEWFPGTAAVGPVWSKASVPLAQYLEDNFETIRTELGGLLAEGGNFDELSFQESRAEGQDSWPEGGWRAMQFTKAGKSLGSWSTRACREVPRTCELLSTRPELQDCPHAGAALVRLRPGGRLKPQFGAAPGLQCHLPLRADPGARMSVGNQTLAWQTGQALVVDPTFIRQEWHNGVRGENLVLQVSFCHPCEPAQRQHYPGLACPEPRHAPSVQLAGSTGSPGLNAASHGQSGVAPRPSAAAGAVQQQDSAVLKIPFAEAALWAVRQPDLALCLTVNEKCPPDSQHGGPNPLSALNTWNYALNNLKAALRASGVEVDPAVLSTMAQVQAGIQSFLAMPALEQYAAIVSTAVKIFEALSPWLQQQQPAPVALPPPLATLRVPADGRSPGTLAFRLANGHEMPAIGFGTWKLEGDACYQAVRAALELGVRHIDTAEAYGNEAEVGRALRDSGVPREQLFLATKATSVAMGMADPSYLEAILVGQLQALQTEYLDVYMLHAAGVRGEKLQAVWQGMERLVELGRVRSLGVSNFGVQELEELMGFARVKPVYLQNIYKVYKQGEQILGDGNVGVVNWARSQGMMVVGYSIINAWPHLMPPLEDPHVLAIARARGRTASQVLHRWALQHGIAVIPKASSVERIRENMQLLDFELSDAEVSALDGLATLSESTHDQLRPAWYEDVFGLHRPLAAAAPLAASALPQQQLQQQQQPAASGFVEALRDQQCAREPEEVKAAVFTLGGGGHPLAACQAGCAAQADCGYLVFYERSGFCHMFRSCTQQVPAQDGAVIYARQ